MPSTTPERAARWPGGDAQACIYLRTGGFRWPGGMIQHPEGREPTEREWDAIAYLCEEWDFCWRPGPSTPSDPQT